ncbi:hypothetical protein HYH03_015142 [Edaphochlamys debaryana]|uniref:Uncharacterized protein n=1 Tax=Edaphochlamys debaryana TaxID=47281 RepID=A0A835XME4_9CHLO|nr:hypothetical protein HYH03_015142 [Edaphochlamys debaryana]|eukprot:KAG2486179.1 hypothetical protein HYH03_015142 [Edaphochlamys debaryana]
MDAETPADVDVLLFTWDHLTDRARKPHQHPRLVDYTGKGFVCLMTWRGANGQRRLSPVAVCTETPAEAAERARVDRVAGDFEAAAAAKAFAAQPRGRSKTAAGAVPLKTAGLTYAPSTHTSAPGLYAHLLGAHRGKARAALARVLGSASALLAARHPHHHALLTAYCPRLGPLLRELLAPGAGREAGQGAAAQGGKKAAKAAGEAGGRLGPFGTLSYAKNYHNRPHIDQADPPLSFILWALAGEGRIEGGAFVLTSLGIQDEPPPRGTRCRRSHSSMGRGRASAASPAAAAGAGAELGPASPASPAAAPLPATALGPAPAEAAPARGHVPLGPAPVLAPAPQAPPGAALGPAPAPVAPLRARFTPLHGTTLLLATRVVVHGTEPITATSGSAARIGSALWLRRGVVAAWRGFAEGSRRVMAKNRKRRLAECGEAEASEYVLGRMRQDKAGAKALRKLAMSQAPGGAVEGLFRPEGVQEEAGCWGVVAAPGAAEAAAGEAERLQEAETGPKEAGTKKAGPKRARRA